MIKIKYTPKFYVWLFWILITVPAVTLATIFILISTGNLGEMPAFEDLENPKNNLASEVYSEDGKILGSFYYENRSYVDYNELSIISLISSSIVFVNSFF